MKFHALKPALLVLFAVLTACSPKQKEVAKPTAPAAETGALLTVGTLSINQADLDHQLKETHGGRADETSRREALAALTTRAQLAQAALDAGLLNHPSVRSEIARILGNQLKQNELLPKIKAPAMPTETRLRELYAEQGSRFQSNEKRQVAVLWLNPNSNPERVTQYQEKLAAARTWLLENDELKSHPEQGFSSLSVDHSEHHASRYKGGIVGWTESIGGQDDWSKALAEIAFSLPEPGAVSEVITRPEGVFLVRYMATQPAILRPLESVADELVRFEQQRLRKNAESEFHQAIAEKYPARPLR